MKIIFFKLANLALEKALKGKTITMFCFLILASTTAYCGGAAPYTEEAAKKVEAVAARMDKPKFEQNLSSEEKQRKVIEYMHRVFDEAGYSYDATIVKIAEDMQYHPDRIPKGITIVNHVVVGLHFMISECNYVKVDCLKFFSSDAADAIRTLMRITGFKP